MTQTFVAIGIVLAVLTLDDPLSSQTRPDLSGTWRLDETRSDPIPVTKLGPDGKPGPPPGSRPKMLVITQTSAMLTIDETSGKGMRRFTFKLDGTESMNWRGPIQMRSRSSWEGSKLVFSTTNFVEYDNFGNEKEVYSLQDGSLILERTLHRRDGTILTNMLVFVR
jgi:hypothetical protein